MQMIIQESGKCRRMDNAIKLHTTQNRALKQHYALSKNNRGQTPIKSDPFSRTPESQSGNGRQPAFIGEL